MFVEDVRTMYLPGTETLAPRRPRSRKPNGTGAEQSIHFIKYMGSKRNLLGFVAPVVREATRPGGRLLDLFAGSHSVGYALKEHAAVWGNDIQHYTVPIGETLLLTNPQLVVAADLRRLLPPVAASYFDKAARLFGDWLERERVVLARVSEKRAGGFDEYLAYSADLHAAMPHQGDPSKLCAGLRDLVGRVARGERTDPPVMAAVYWADTYFSLEQALWLDAYRAAIEACLPPPHPARATALACVLHAATYCSVSSGHFAQFHRTMTPKKLAEHLLYRLRSVEDYWASKVAEVEDDLVGSPRPNRVTALDFRAAIADLQGVDAIYADPPYSFVHYSRFYHALETLALYDAPGTEFDGRYRPVPLRHQSPFCIRSQMRGAFESVLRAARDARVPIVWSYSKSGLMPFSELLALCRS